MIHVVILMGAPPMIFLKHLRKVVFYIIIFIPVLINMAILARYEFISKRKRGHFWIWFNITKFVVNIKLKAKPKKIWMIRESMQNKIIKLMILFL